VDGYFEEDIHNNNTFEAFARQEIAKKYSKPTDSINGSLDLIHVHQNDYFTQLLANDLLPILEDIKTSIRTI